MKEGWTLPQRVEYGDFPRPLILAGIPAILAVGAVIVYVRDPAAGEGIIPCLFNRWTGLYCTGCGATRALHALLHGHLLQALDYNLFMIMTLPLVGYALLAYWLKRLLNRPVLPMLKDYRWLMIVLVIFAVVFLILRNLPWAPVTWLAP